MPELIRVSAFRSDSIACKCHLTVQCLRAGGNYIVGIYQDNRLRNCCKARIDNFIRCRVNRFEIVASCA